MKTHRIGKLERKINNFFLNEEVVSSFEDRDILSKFNLSFFVLSFFSMIGVMPSLMFGWQLPDYTLLVVFGFVSFVCLYFVVSSMERIIKFDFKYHFFRTRFWSIAICLFWLIFIATFSVILPLFGYHIFHFEIETETQIVVKHHYLSPVPLVVWIAFYFFESFSFSGRLAKRGLEIKSNIRNPHAKNPFYLDGLDKAIRLSDNNSPLMVIFVLIVAIVLTIIFFD